MAKISICIDVSSIDKGIDFYCEALGCTLINKRDSYTELLFDGITIYLSEKENGSNPLLNHHAKRDFERHWTPVHLDFHVDNIQHSVEKIIEYDGTKEGESNGDWGSAAFCADPFGNGFCVIHYHSK